MFNTIIMIVVITGALLAFIENERQRMAKRRAAKRTMLGYIKNLPTTIGLERNARARWQ